MLIKRMIQKSAGRIARKRIMFFTPRENLEKLLFTSVLENYYDKNKIDSLKNYMEIRIQEKHNKIKNSYCILNLIFQEQTQSTEEATIEDSRSSIINKYLLIDIILNFT